MELPILTFVFFLTALTYSSVGFGGGSTYLAWLVLFSAPYQAMPKIALLCNVVVVSGGLYHHVRAGYLQLGRIAPWIITSVPFAYLGGKTPISEKWFLALLCLSLGVAGIRLFIGAKDGSREDHPAKRTGATWFFGLILGAALGFLAGLVGIGGGIFLAPLLYFLRWGKAREIAAQSCFFIFVNSLAGLAGQFAKNSGGIDGTFVLPLILAVLLGGQVGTLMSIKKISLTTLQKITATLVLFVAGQIFWRLVIT